MKRLPNNLGGGLLKRKFIKNKWELNRLLTDTAQNMLNTGQKNAADILREEVKDSFSTFSPDKYKRTGDFLRSIKIERPEFNTKNIIKRNIIFDGDKMRAIPWSGKGKKRTWGKHTQYNGDKFAGNDLVGVLNYGQARPQFFPHPAFRFLETTFMRMNVEVKDVNFFTKRSYSKSLEQRDFEREVLPTGIIIKKKRDK